MCSGFNYLSVLAVGGGSGDWQHFVLAIHWRFRHFVWIMTLLIVNTTLFAVTFGLAHTWTDSCIVSSGYQLHWKWNLLGIDEMCKLLKTWWQSEFWCYTYFAGWEKTIYKTLGNLAGCSSESCRLRAWHGCSSSLREAFPAMWMSLYDFQSTTFKYPGLFSQLEVCWLMLNGLTNFCVSLEKKCSMLPSLFHLTVFPITSICA